MHSNSSFSRITSQLTLLVGAGALAFLAGCYTGPERTGYRSSGPGPVIVQDDYVYYPGDEVYYNNTRHQYVYRDGNAWVNRPQPPHGWAQNAPSVHVDFHDAPERHHAEVTKTYPKNWHSVPPAKPAHNDDHRDDHNDNDRHDNDRHN